MSLYLLFLLGYLLSACGAAVIVAAPIRRVLGFDSAPEHADPDTLADAELIKLAVIVGVAALWPVTIGLYALTRFIPASMS